MEGIMKAYCILNGYTKEMFQEEDKEKYTDFNVKRYTREKINDIKYESDLSKEKDLQYRFHGISGECLPIEDETEDESDTDENKELKRKERKDILMAQNCLFCNSLTSLITSDEFAMDLWNDLLLIVKYLKKDRERLYPEMKKSNIKVITRNSNGEYFADDESEQYRNYIKKMKETIHTLNSDKRVNYRYIFDVSELKSRNKLSMIYSFGSEVVRLWLYSSEFRNLFVDTVNNVDKYELFNIAKFDTLYKSYKADDAIILEKMLGLSTLYYFIAYITNTFEEFELCDVEKAIDILMDFNGEYTRCGIIQLLGFHLYDWNFKNKTQNKKQKLKNHIELLEYYCPILNDIYKKTLKDIMDFYSSIYTFETFEKIVEEKRAELKSSGYPGIMNDPLYYKCIQRKDDLDFLHNLEHFKSEEEKMIFLKDNRDVRQLLQPFYYECDGMQRAILYPWPVEDKQSSKRAEIWKTIIQKNMCKYQK